ncbi:MAG: DUF342 domain-containing protein [Epulopiscium sp.]|nr:DUF342 domain-containing protein [Candidatus Epulonipiscium sp.]
MNRNEINQQTDFELQAKHDGIYLEIRKPSQTSIDLMLEGIIHTLERNKIYEYSLQEIKQALQNKAPVVEVKVSEQMELATLDEEMQLEISSNRMYAVVSFKPSQKGGKSLEPGQIKRMLADHKVCFGLDEDLIHKLEKEKQYYHKYIIAQGKEAIPGKDGELIYHFQIKKEATFLEKEDGTVDFHHLDLIENVRKGQPLVTAIPPEDGIPGTTVLGEEIIPKKGKAIRLPVGKNTEISQDETQLIATTDGQVLFTDNKISVYEVYEVPANVGTSTGNIDFVGNVVVKGNVLTGFSIKAGGNIEVYGVVEGAHLIAEGDIILYRGMQGIGRGQLQAGGNVVAKYIENSHVEAEKDVKSEAIMHSTVKAGLSIVVEGKRGLIVGGVLRAGQEIVAKTIGSSMATATVLEVGLDPTIVEHFRNLKQSLKETEKEAKQVDQAITILTRMQETRELTAERKEMLVKTTRTKILLQQKMLNIRNEIDKVAPLLEVKTLGKVKAMKLVYPGVKVTIGTSSMYIREDIQYCTLYVDQGDIKVDVYR